MSEVIKLHRVFGGKAEAVASLGWVRGKECPHEKAPGSYWDPSECAKSPRGPVKVPRGHIPERKSKKAAEEEESGEKGAAGGDNAMRQSEQAEALRNVTDCKDERITGSWQGLDTGEETGAAWKSTIRLSGSTWRKSETVRRLNFCSFPRHFKSPLSFNLSALTGKPSMLLLVTH